MRWLIFYATCNTRIALEKRWSWGCTHTSFRTPSQFWHASEWNEQLKSAHNLIKDVKRGSELWPNDRCQIVAFVGLGVFRFTSFIWCSLACLLDCLASLPPAVGPLITILGVRVQKSKVLATNVATLIRTHLLEIPFQLEPAFMRQDLLECPANGFQQSSAARRAKCSGTELRIKSVKGQLLLMCFNEAFKAAAPPPLDLWPNPG